MSTASYHFIYLSPEVRDVRWSSLHRFLHPGSYSRDQQNMVLCSDLDMSHHIFLTATLKDWTGDKSKMVFLRYDLVDAILELVSHKNPLGFASPEKPLDEQLESLESE
jgi:hypothetical protein